MHGTVALASRLSRTRERKGLRAQHGGGEGRWLRTVPSPIPPLARRATFPLPPCGRGHDRGHWDEQDRSHNRFRANLLPLWRQRPVHRAALRQVSREPRRRGPALAAILCRPGRQRRHWPSSRSRAPPGAQGLAPAESGDLVSALDGNWPVAPPPAAKGAKGAAAEAKAPGLSADDVRKATMDSVRALMMIRAYRMRGHLAADLDPLKLKEPREPPGARPRHLRLQPKPTWTARSSSTRCWASNTPPSARSSTS